MYLSDLRCLLTKFRRHQQKYFFTNIVKKVVQLQEITSFLKSRILNIPVRSATTFSSLLLRKRPRRGAETCTKITEERRSPAQTVGCLRRKGQANPASSIYHPWFGGLQPSFSVHQAWQRHLLLRPDNTQRRVSLHRPAFQISILEWFAVAFLSVGH